MTTPLLSVVVIFHNMRREAKRTLFSLSAAYQKGVDVKDYEVIAIDNGSDQPLDPAMIAEMGAQFRYHFLDTKSVSPVDALNLGALMARGEKIALIVDGARMATPGLLRATIEALKMSENPFLCSLSWHLGPDVQNNSILQGYDQAVEDALLNSIAWPSDGYQMFDISTLAQSSRPGFYGGFPEECSWVCLSRSMFDQLEGYDPAFQSPGGGLVNHDFVNRAVAMPETTPIVLLGEGVFHQFHGGVATNVKMESHPIHKFRDEYRSIRGLDYRPSEIGHVVYYGELPSVAKRFVAMSS
jgi:glycosyltransferase involved in cell wall biosynthesis